VMSSSFSASLSSSVCVFGWTEGARCRVDIVVVVYVVCVVVLKARKRRRVELNFTLKARAFFCVDVRKEWIEKKRVENERFFMKE
jgi:hypothetical protein